MYIFFKLKIKIENWSSMRNVEYYPPIIKKKNIEFNGYCKTG